MLGNISFTRGVVVAQLAEQSLPTPVVHDSNPVIGKIYIEDIYSVNSISKAKIRKRGLD